MFNIIKSNEKIVLQYVKLDFQNVDRQTGGKWLIHGTNSRLAGWVQL